ncbi:MAG: hypothetical protein ACE5OP_12265 [Candidatus Glassbacteria bacterium]
MDLKNISLKNLALYVSDHLRKNGIDTVLSGGACVTIYTDQKYLSYDLDFVPVSFVDRRTLRSVLEEICFREEGRHFAHEDTPFYIDFIAPPLSVGSEPVKDISIIEEGDMVLKLLSPTDCTKDRLAAYYHWDDRQSLEQAILVCKNNDIDLKEIQRWSKIEGMSDKYLVFKRLLGENR